jgi:erythromycin esterase-like protein
MPASPDEPMGDEARSALDRLLEGKRFVFLGEPDHFLIEKYPYRLVFIRHLFERGWRHVGMEVGRSTGWRLDHYIQTGDRAYLPRAGSEDGYDYRKAYGDMYDFIERTEPAFLADLRKLSQSRPDGEPRLRFFGFDFDLGRPLAAVEPIQALLDEYARDDSVRGLLKALSELQSLETEQRLTRVEAMRMDVSKRRDVFVGSIGEGRWRLLQSWMRTLHFGVAAVNRPREAQDPAGHRLWRAGRERTMMEHMDDIVAALGPDDKVILLGHNGHLSKDASKLFFRPQRGVFWGCGSWFRALGYGAYEKATRRPLNMHGQSVGAHVHNRFPGQVLSIWMLYGRGQLMGRDGPIDVRLHGDTVESLLAQAGDRFLLPLDRMDPAARDVLVRANLRSASGRYASADLTAQTDALYFVKDVSVEED